MESRSIFVATITIYCGLFYLTEALDEYTKIILFVVIVCANVYFLLYWCTKMFQVCLNMAKKKLPCLSKNDCEENKGTMTELEIDMSVTFANEQPYEKPENEKTLSFESMKDYYLYYLDHSVGNKSNKG